MSKSRDWSKSPVIIKWLDMRKTSGEALRKAVWREMAPLRAALSNRGEHHD